MAEKQMGSVVEAGSDRFQIIDVGIESDTAIYERISGAVEYEHHLVRLDDDTPYEYRLLRPLAPKSDTAIAMTTPWFTSIRGHNMRTALQFAKLGYPVILVGPEGSYDDPEASLVTKARRAAQINLARSSQIMAKIVARGLEQLDVRDNEIIVYGESRAAMIAFGLMVPEYSNDIKVAYAEQIAPCFPESCDMKKALGVGLQVPGELLALGKFVLVHANTPSFKHYPQTVDLNPTFVMNAVGTTIPLFDGTAGQLAEYSDPSTPKRLTLFKNDVASNPDGWERKLAEHHTVFIKMIEGSHLNIPYYGIVEKTKMRLLNLMEQRGADGSFAAVDFDAVFTASEEQRL